MTIETLALASLSLNVFQAVLLVYVVGFITAKPKRNPPAPRAPKA